MFGSNKNQGDVQQALVNGSTRIQRFVRKFSLCPQDEADCIQESIARVLEQARSNHVHNPVAYAMSIAKNLVFKKTSENPIKEWSEEEVPSFSLEDSIEYKQRMQHVNIALSQMPELRRTVLIRKRYYGESRKQIAEILGISEESVKKHITRAMADLQYHMDNI